SARPATSLQPRPHGVARVDGTAARRRGVVDHRGWNAGDILRALGADEGNLIGRRGSLLQASRSRSACSKPNAAATPAWVTAPSYTLTPRRKAGFSRSARGNPLSASSRV